MYLADGNNVKRGQVSSALHHRYLAKVPSAMSVQSLQSRFERLNRAIDEENSAPVDAIVEEIGIMANTSQRKGDPDAFFGVELVLAQRRTKEGGREYYVKWAGYDWSECSWEPEENLTEDLIASPSVMTSLDVTKKKNVDRILAQLIKKLSGT